MKYSLAFITLFFINTSFAAEADHYTDRNQPLEDISAQVNLRANDYLRKGVAETNQLGACADSVASEELLYVNLRKYFGNHTKGQLVKDVLHDEEFTKRKIVLSKSIFESWSVWNGYLLGKKSAASSPLALSPMIQMGEQLVGIDKLEHMFGMGFSYFKRHYIGGKALRNVLKRGIALEKTILGGNMLATGVFSYGDLAANFNGMRFWNHMLQKRDDVLGAAKNIGPYVSCKNKKWVVVESNPIDLTKYIDASMDESINCNKFATKSGARKYDASMNRRSTEIQSLSCPMSENALQNMVEKYSVVIESDSKKRSINHWIINTKGIDDVSYTNEF